MEPSATFLAIIPARGGSKRLHRKNILQLHNKPLIAYSIQAGLECSFITDVVVSSDDSEILDIAKQFGASTIKRPIELSSDTSTSFEAIQHTIENMQEYDYIVLLQPTSPLRNFHHINEAIKLLKEKNADAIVSVSPMEHSPLWSNTLNEDLSMQNFLADDLINKRSQDLETFYRLNGAIYICKTSALLENKGFMLKDNIFAFIMDKNSSIDIDEQFDFDLAEAILNSSTTLI